MPLEAYFLKSNRSTFMKGPPTSWTIDAVPSLTNLPDEVTGREDPGLLPFIAASTLIAVPPLPEAEVVFLLLVPGRAKPVTGRPLPVIGLTDWLGLPLDWVIGRDRDVPGRATWAVSFSSRSMSAIPSSSISVSSIQFFKVKALNFMYQMA